MVHSQSSTPGGMRGREWGDDEDDDEDDQDDDDVDADEDNDFSSLADESVAAFCTHCRHLSLVLFVFWERYCQANVLQRCARYVLPSSSSNTD